MNELKSIISASLLSANAAALGQEAQAILKAGADWIHLDVMDNHYVPNLSFGPLVCQALRKMDPGLFLEVHLMVHPVDGLIKAFASAGASMLSIHPKTTANLTNSLQLIRDQGCLTGLVFNPTTPLEPWRAFISTVDLVLMMSVEPGFGGQPLIPAVLEKIRMVRGIIQDSGAKTRLSVDGGIHAGNIQLLKAAGADTFVIGSSLFRSPHYQATLEQLRALID